MHIIALASKKGGVGKSTLAMHLAWGLTFDGSQVVVVDTDPQGTVTTWHMAALDRDTPLPYRVLNYWADDTNKPGQLRAFLQREAQDADCVIIDCPAGASDVTTQQALMLSNLALIPVQPSAADMWATRATVKLAELAQAAKRERNADLEYCIVVNQMQQQSAVQKAMLEQLEDLRAPVLKSRIKRRSQYQEAPALGKTVFSPGLRGDARNEMTAFVAEVKRKLRGK